jgi:hypothetical protein
MTETKMIEGQFNESSGWMFRRVEDGSVEIQPGATVLGAGGYPVHLVSPDAWASMVAHVSARGESGETFRAAQAFHAGTVSTTISTRAELLALLDAEGRLSRPVTLADGCTLTDLSSLTSLDGLTLAAGCGLYGLSSVTTLGGLTMAPDCWLTGLSSVTTLAGLTMAEGCRLYDLSALTTLDGLTMAKGCELHGLSAAMQAELAKLRAVAP